MVSVFDGSFMCQNNATTGNRMVRGGGSSYEFGWNHLIGGDKKHTASESLSRSLVSAQKTESDPKIAMETADGTNHDDHGREKRMELRVRGIYREMQLDLMNGYRTYTVGVLSD